jgi:hypothetical protein
MKILPKTDYFPSPQWLKYWMIFHTHGLHSMEVPLVLLAKMGMVLMGLGVGMVEKVLLRMILLVEMVLVLVELPVGMVFIMLEMARHAGSSQGGTSGGDSPHNKVGSSCRDGPHDDSLSGDSLRCGPRGGASCGGTSGGDYVCDAGDGSFRGDGTHPGSGPSGGASGGGTSGKDGLCDTGDGTHPGWRWSS